MEDKKKLNYKSLGYLEGHNGWVTKIITGHSLAEGEDSNVLISGGRDNKIIIW